MQGAVTGTPGTLPTNWETINGGLTRQVVATGTENGVDYIDIKLSGTASATSATISPESSIQIVAAQNQVWTNSSYLKIIAAPLPPVSYSLGFREGLAAGSFVAFGSTAVTPTTTLARLQATRTLTGATTERVQPQLSIGLVSGSTYDFTIRIGWPQIEQGSVATSPIRTTAAAATRNADVISKTGVSGFIGQTEGTLYIDLDYNQPPNDPAGRLLNVYETNDTTNSILPFINNINQFQLATFSGGSPTVAIVASAATVVPFGQNKFAIAYNGVNYTVYRNGLLFASGTGLAPASLTAILLGSSLFNTRSINNRIRAAAIYTTRLEDDELIALTSL
jgi:hypothetical protein